MKRKRIMAVALSGMLMLQNVMWVNAEDTFSFDETEIEESVLEDEDVDDTGVEDESSLEETQTDSLEADVFAEGLIEDPQIEEFVVSGEEDAAASYQAMQFSTLPVINLQAENNVVFSQGATEVWYKYIAPQQGFYAFWYAKDSTYLDEEGNGLRIYDENLNNIASTAYLKSNGLVCEMNGGETYYMKFIRSNEEEDQNYTLHADRWNSYLTVGENVVKGERGIKPTAYFSAEENGVYTFTMPAQEMGSNELSILEKDSSGAYLENKESSSGEALDLSIYLEKGHDYTLQLSGYGGERIESPLDTYSVNVKREGVALSYQKRYEPFVGEDCAVSVDVFGAEGKDVQYSWKIDDQESDETGNTLTLHHVQNNKYINCTVTVGGERKEAWIYVAPQQKSQGVDDSIVTDYQYYTVLKGKDVELSVPVERLQGDNLQYVWGSSSDPYLDENAPTITVRNMQYNDSYTCKVYSSEGKKIGEFIYELEVKTLINNSSSDETKTIAMGEQVVLKPDVSASSDQLTYAWFGGYPDASGYVDIDGWEELGSEESLDVTQRLPGMRKFKCVISYEGEKIEQYYSIKYVNTLTTANPKETVIYPSIDQKQVTLTVKDAKSDYGNVSYRWYDDQYNRIENEQSASLTVDTKIKDGDSEKTYLCRIRDSYNSMTLTFSIRNAKLLEEEGQVTKVFTAGDDAVDLHVTPAEEAVNHGEIIYSWTRDGELLKGEHGTSLEVADIQCLHMYTCYAKNELSSSEVHFIVYPENGLSPSFEQAKPIQYRELTSYSALGEIKEGNIWGYGTNAAAYLQFTAPESGDYDVHIRINDNLSAWKIYDEDKNLLNEKIYSSSTAIRKSAEGSFQAEAGKRYYICINPQRSAGGDVLISKHGEEILCQHTRTETSVVRSATCEQEGLRRVVCKDCGTIVGTETIPKLAHQYVENIAAKIDPTCSKNGSRVYICSICAHEQIEEIPSTGNHTWTSWEKATEATVLTEATEKRHCTVCGESETRTVAGSKLAATGSANAASVPLKLKQATTKLAVIGMADGDRVVSWSSSNPKIVTVGADGKVKAGKKVGKATVTATLASGKTVEFKIATQKKVVKTKKITGLNKKMTVKVGATETLRPVLSPITSTEK